jgi:hypothetical protein
MKLPKGLNEWLANGERGISIDDLRAAQRITLILVVTVNIVVLTAIVLLGLIGKI